MSPKLLRLLLVTNLYPPQELGGYGRSMADFCWGLQQRGHTVCVVSSDAPYLGAGGSQGPSGEPVDRRLELLGSFDGGVQPLKDPQQQQQRLQRNQALLRQRMQEGWDGVLVGNLDLLGPALLGPLLEPGIPVLHHIGFVTPPFPRQQLPTAAHYRLIGASRAVQHNLREAGFAVNETVVYPGAREDLLGPAATGRTLPAPLNGWIPQPQRLGTAADPLKLCFAGLLIGSKGAHTLVQALIRLHQRQLQVQVTLAGFAFQAGYQEKITALLRQHGLEDCVLFAGSLGRPQLARMLVLHQVGVFPSTYPEAFGIVGAEMQLSGLALVSSGVGGAAELVEHGVTGLRFQPGDPEDLANQLQLLADDPALLRRLARAGQAQARQRFSVGSSCQQLEQLLQNG